MADTSTRSKILAILRNADKAVSGEVIAAGIGVSRVAVWKGIQTLNESGYTITSSTSGYLLETDLSDGLFPWEFGSDESRFRHWDDTDSTMNRAREAALSLCPDGLVVTAERQNAGRGTGEKKWESVRGGLFFTLVTRPEVNASYYYRQVLRAQVAAVRSIEAVSGKRADILWPNDIYLTGSKAGGILGETLISGNGIVYSNLGVGINTGIKPSLPGTASVAGNRKDLLTRFLAEFENMSCTSGDLLQAWNAKCPLMEKTVCYRLASLGHAPGGHSADGPVQTGIFRGVNASGWAVIASASQTERHQEETFPPGTITILDKGTEK